ncbi:hypothetical protein LTR56_004308 [Elasticomyces elasticus]|nr:hypothetical protein LTR22_012036 [Elasticomyces elasticus]KAK3653896.1 hypothetical protein LTR56_004308 [Elasticomyces elasticus]KAK4919308.1 hypothetical protein LTR49_013006 [Elasticomyces elasticus]KAK5748716.1 hypothetical protein LTS12_021227 [Elasticomyces elasticus]
MRQKVDAMTPEDCATERLELEAVLKDMEAMPEPDERQDIIDALESGTHELLLERNGATNTKCRAEKCVVQAECKQQYDENITGPYRINLNAIKPSSRHWSEMEKPNRNFYHLSCFEAIGVDMVKYLKFHGTKTVKTNDVCEVIMTVPDGIPYCAKQWAANDGACWPSKLYDNDKFHAAKEEYKRLQEAQKVGEPDPAKPKIQDFLTADQMCAGTLSQVLLDNMGACHLLRLKSSTLMHILEVWGRVPDELTRETIQAKLDKQAAERKEKEGSGGDDKHAAAEGASDESATGATTIRETLTVGVESA